MPQEKFSQVLPGDWDGRFPFTNDSDEDFVFTWAKKSYLFPAKSTVDMMKLNLNATPIEVMNIRKFAAKKWAEREFFKSPKYNSIRSSEGERDGNGVIQPRLTSFTSARSYTEEDLKDGIQRCLKPLPEGTPLVAQAETRNTEEEIHRDGQTGEPISKVTANTTQSINDKPGFVLVN